MFRSVFASMTLVAAIAGGQAAAAPVSPEAEAGAPRLTDRFSALEPQIRGFDTRGAGPRIVRVPVDDTVADDAIGGRAYYIQRAELEIPLGEEARADGLRPSIFVDVGALYAVRSPARLDGSVEEGRAPPCRETCPGATPAPRLSIGYGVNWNSPFGPFRIDIARALTTAPGDDTRLFTFNVGTAY